LNPNESEADMTIDKCPICNTNIQSAEEKHMNQLDTLASRLGDLAEKRCAITTWNVPYDQCLEDLQEVLKELHMVVDCLEKDHSDTQTYQDALIELETLKERIQDLQCPGMGISQEEWDSGDDIDWPALVRELIHLVHLGEYGDGQESTEEIMERATRLSGYKPADKPPMPEVLVPLPDPGMVEAQQKLWDLCLAAQDITKHHNAADCQTPEAFALLKEMTSLTKTVKGQWPDNSKELLEKVEETLRELALTLTGSI
jgi:hypothetical protein